MRYEFTNHEGRRIGVVARRTGEFELVVYSKGDPDASQLMVRLSSPEADALAEILGAPRMAERFADLTKEVPGLIAAQVQVSAGSPFANQPLGQTRARTKTGHPLSPSSAVTTWSPHPPRVRFSGPKTSL